MTKKIEEVLPPVAAVEGAEPERPTAVASAVVVVGTDGKPVETAPAPKRRGRPPGNGAKKEVVAVEAEFKIKLRLEHVQGNTRVIYDRAATALAAEGKHPLSAVVPIVEAWIREIDGEVVRQE